MKKIYKYLLLTMLTTGTLFYSCETVELENLTSPNALSPTQADVNLLLNRVQMEYLFSIRTFNNIGADLGRIEYMFGRNYFDNYGSGSVQTPWNNLYGDMIPDIAAIEAQHSVDNDLSYHLGVSKLLQGHLMMVMVDFLGDIVFTQANNPNEFPTPELDDDQAVYTAALALIDEAIGYFNAAGSSAPSGVLDLFYGGSSGGSGDAAKWIKLANTIKMRANLTVGNYAAVLSATNVLSSTDDDFEFSYGTDIVLPDNDNRHNDYEQDYRSDGANIYHSNWLMDLMVSDFGTADQLGVLFDPIGSTDPRRRYYFFRQHWATPNNYALFTDVEGRFGPPGAVYLHNEDPDAQTIECSGNSTPAHLEFTPDEDFWCSVKLGYWGRTHGNDEGIPPDNFTRTAVSVYPAGGSFDGNADAFPFVAQYDENGDYIGYVASINKLFKQQVGLGKGGGGAGIEPIILASYVEFWKAEANLMSGNAPAASTNIENALGLSIAKVMSFGALDGSADFSEVPDTATINAFVARIKAEFDAADLTTALDGQDYPTAKDQMDILGEQFFVTMYGGGADAFNFIRRTGYPRTIARNVEAIAGSGLFPRTVLYPGNEVGANPNIQQRTDHSTLVFWDSGVTNPAN